MKLGAKINVMFITILLIGSTILGVVLSVAIQGSIEDFATDKVKNDSNIVYEYIDKVYPGQWAIKNGDFYKGNAAVDTKALANTFSEKTGDDVTFTIGETVDATTSEHTEMPTTLTNVLQHGTAFYGKVTGTEQSLQAAIVPLKANGKTIGALYMTAPDNYISTLVSNIIQRFTIIIAIILVFAIAVLALFTRSIRKRLMNVTESLKEAGKGNFTRQLKDTSKDELGDVATSYNQMTKNVKMLMSDIQTHSQQVEQAAQAFVDGADQTIQSTENAVKAVADIVDHIEVQQRMIAESAIAVEDVTESITVISKNANEAVAQSVSSKQKAIDGQKSVENVVAQMSVINEANLETNEVIEQLAQRSTQIGKIIEAITSIAEQTNLLALNAAIESARAGEHGKGFAVVAGEVRKLAAQSQTSAKLISNIIEAIQEDTRKVSQLMQHTNVEIQNGMKVAKKSGTTFKDIYTSVESANAQITALSSITEEMAANMAQMNVAFKEVSALATSTSQDVRIISTTTDEQLSVAEQVLAAAKQLEIQSAGLDQSISQFKMS